MAAPLVRRQPRSIGSASAVLLTKQDYEELRTHALSPSRELPRCLPISAPAPRSSTPGRAPAGGFLGALPAPQRRTRSASNRRRPTSLVSPPGAEAAELCSGAGNTGATEVVQAAKVTRVVRTQHLAYGARAEQKAFDLRGLAGVRAKPAVAGFGASAAASAVPAAGLGLELCGFDPRKLPRPAERPPAKAVAPGQVPAAPVPAAAAPPALAVSGQAAPVSHTAASSDSPPPGDGPGEFQLPDWSSSEDEGPQDSEGEAFYYRRYRYREAQVRSSPAPAEAPRRRLRRACPAREGGADSEGDCALPWPGDGSWPPPSGWAQPGGSRCSTPRCEDERPEAELKRVAEVLVRFYGLPGGVERAVRFRSNMSNLAIVEESAWRQRQRESRLDEPPMVWVRGGRVYDFHGDRGTLAEFEHDLLTRQVEDDSTCRQRRREQGLMPFPFVASPLKRSSEDHPEEQADGREGARRGHGV